MSLALILILDERNLSKLQLPVFPRTRFDFNGKLHYLKSVLEPISSPLQHGLNWFEDDEGLVVTQTDSYGDPLEFIVAGELIPYLKESICGPWDSAAVAYLEALDFETPVVLYWQ
jgi:hypothetical protein